MDKVDNHGEVRQKEQAIHSLKDALERITFKELIPDPNAYISVFSSDEGVSENIPEIVSGIEGQQTNNLRVGLVVGSGGLLSLGSILPQINLWIVADMNPSEIDVLKEHHKKTAEAKDYQQLLNEISAPFAGKNALTQRIPLVERNSYDKFYYLSSAERLKSAQDFLKKDNIAYLNVDLTDQDSLARVGDVLTQHSANIAFANMTNVMEWVPGFENDLSQPIVQKSFFKLPILKDCVFLHSLSTGRIGRSPIITHTAVGLADYLKGTAYPNHNLARYSP